MALKFLAGLAAVATGVQVGSAAERLTRRAARLGHSLAQPDAGYWIRADRFIVCASSFMTLLLLARFLELATFGAFVLAYTALLLFMAMQKAWVAEPHCALGAALSGPERARHTAALALLQGMGGLALCAVLCIAGGVAAALVSPAAGDVLIALAVTAVPWLAQDFLRRALHARGRSRDAAINSLVTQGLQLFGTVVLCSMAASWATPVSGLSVLALSAMVGAIVGMWQLQPLADFGQGGRGQYRRAWADALRHGTARSAPAGCAWVAEQGPSWIVALLLGLDALALYRAVAHPTAAGDPFLQAGRGTRRPTGALLYLLAPFIVLVALFPTPVLELAYGEKFAEGGLAPILVLSAAAAGLGYARIPLAGGLAELRAFHPSLVHLLPAALTALLSVVLVCFLGLVGAPLTVLAVNLALLAAAWLGKRRAAALTGR